VIFKSNELEARIARRSLLIKFTRPEIRNPLSVAVLGQLESLVDGAGKNADQVIFTGSDAAFASGANLREIDAIQPDEVRPFAERGQRLMEKIADLGPRTVAAINGFCFGGALDLALACDVRIAAPTASFAHPGTGLGIITGWGGTQRLPRLVGQANALEMFFTASPINAERAFRVGLIDLIADNIFDNELLRLPEMH
jgi:enoyl-CoA hydratase/carnithine racemase